MKSHFTYRALFAALLLAVILIFSACAANDEAPMASEKPMESEDTMMSEDTAEDETAKVDEDTMESDAAMDSEDTMESEAPAEDTMTEGDKVFTLEELSQYDGKEGRPAYVAIDGVVYDVSDKALWAGGEHQNRVSAGKDLSEEINSSPHGKSKLDGLPVVGKLAED